MLSAGNDIVSLAEINVSRTISQQFYSKILSGAEVSLYQKVVPPFIPFEAYVWLLWSVKEAAYKFLKRIDPQLIFTPVKFNVKQLDIPPNYAVTKFNNAEIIRTGFSDLPVLKGVVEVASYKVYTNSIIYTDCITSVADNDEKFDAVYWGIRKISFTDHVIQSEEVRRFLFSRAAIITGRNELLINKDSHGIPLLFDGEEELRIPVSLAHHGKYIGYSFKI